MRRGSRPKFDNILLKRWLLKVGPVRRKTLLTKFRADLVRLGLPKFAWRKGLLQLSSRPFVHLIRHATTKMNGNDDIKNPRLKSRKPSPSSNNNNNSNSKNQESDRISDFSSYRKHVNNKRHDLPTLECNTSGTVSMPKELEDKSKNIGKPEELGRRYPLKSRSSKSQDWPRRNRKHWVAVKGDNPNGINWHLIPIDMDNPAKSPGPRLLQLSQVDKKKARLYTKFLEIFGEDVDIPKLDNSISIKRNQETIIRCQDTSDTLYRKSPIFSKHSRKWKKAPHAMRNKKKPRTEDSTFSNNVSTEGEDSLGGSQEKISSLQQDALTVNSIVASADLLIEYRATTYAAVQDIYTDNGTTATTITLTIDTVNDKGNDPSIKTNNGKDKETQSQALDSGLTAKRDQHDSPVSVNALSTPLTEVLAPQQQSAIVMLEKNHGKPVHARSIQSDLVLESESTLNQEADFIPNAETRNSTAPGVNISTNETILVNMRLQTPDSSEIHVSSRGRNLKSKPASLLDPAVQLPGPSKEARSPLIDKQPSNFIPEAETENSSALGVNTSISEVTTNNIRLQEPYLPETRVSSYQRNPKSEPADLLEPVASLPRLSEQALPLIYEHPSNVDLNRGSPDNSDNDPSPSSTTDTESGNMLGPATASMSDRVLGALDNVYLVLHCRRRIREREQAASKLAIMRNRQEEVLQAKHEFESKLMMFREELSYLFNKLDSWDHVLRFISQGLNNRTPPGTKPFSIAEMKRAMLEAEVKIPFGAITKESAAVPEFQPVRTVLCMIDLTVDNREDDVMIDLCDSSTDPPRSQNHHATMKPKIETYNDADGSFWKHNIDANIIQNNFPSIADVKTISPQQFETIGQRLEAGPTGNDNPCYLCFRTSLVACGQCTRATYCSKICQELHWEQSHHATCVPLEGVIHSRT